jgi:parallel beta-helix repeat protein/predicted outer membrane repeat protein
MTKLIPAVICLFLIIPCQAKTIYVDANAPGFDNGTSWVNAYHFLQDALSDANSAAKPVEIRVAQGIYIPDCNSTDPNGSGDRSATFQLINGVTLKGGYAGYGEPDPNVRDIELHETILSGDLASNDVDVNDLSSSSYDPSRVDNSYTVVTGSWTDSNVVMDGFTITAGYANGSSSPDKRGGGMFCDSNATVTNCTFTGNYAIIGGGMYNWGGNPIVKSCTFSENLVYGSGGGMYNMGSSSPTLINCSFIGNHAGYDGGGMYNLISSPAVKGCAFSGNSANEDGGGMYNENCSPMVENSTFIENSALANDGGAIYNYQSNLVVKFCTFTANSANNCGGGLYNNISSPTVKSCTFQENSAYSGAGINNSSSNTMVEGCTFQENSAYSGGAGIKNFRSSPLVNECTFINNSAEYGGGMYSFYYGQPTVNGCTFSGNSANDGGGMANYYKSRPNLTNCTFIENDANNNGGGMYNDNGSPTLTNCTLSSNSAERGGGMYNFYYSYPTVVGCTLSGNSATYYGGGMCSNNNSNPTMTNCTFSDNSAVDGGAMDNRTGSNPNVTNCTFCNNVATGNGGGMYNGNSNPLVTNCILWGNEPNEICDDVNSSTTVTYSDIQQGTHQAWFAEDCIDADPCFADVNNGDYHLQSATGRWDPNSKSWVQDDVTSPCIDAGDPNSDWTAELWPHGKRINMGAFGGTPQASMSPLIDIGYIADLNNDDKVDFGDLKLFTIQWQNEQLLLSEDLDRNGFVDFTDFAIFGQQWSYPSALEPGISYQVEDCNMEGGENQQSAADSNDTRFSVWVEGSYIHFEDLMYANCCPDELGLEKEINGNQITLYEIGYGGLCDCMCYFPITATLGPFEDGTYTVEVIDNYGQSLGIVEVTIGQPTAPGITYQIEDCNRDASGLFAAEPPDRCISSISAKLLPEKTTIDLHIRCFTVFRAG